MADFRYETDRLILRDWRAEDWEPFWRHLNTPTVTRYLGGIADETLSSRVPRHIRRRNAVTLVIRDNLHASVLEHSHA